ncbi:BREX-1 system adenine-specific DNA-methyltransferase PglX [Clostridiales bacterium]|nr:BREX-1 system adenine-specific DNA-methyltransferase PglX [Clostridiales bacterium]
MNKTAIKNFAIWARQKLITDIRYRASLMGITEDGIKDALPQSTSTTEFYDIGTAEPYSISGEAVKQRKHLVEIIRQREQDAGYDTAYKYIIEEVAYTWFNRLIAIRFMEVNDYLPSHIRVLSSENGKLEPDLVTTPFDAGLNFTSEEEEKIMRLKLNNQLDEVFQLLFVKQCNALNETLPALFEKTNDYTELLLNLSVIDEEGVVHHLIHDIDENDFHVELEGQVEIIGWMYQYYNTEPKAEVFKRPSGTKIKKEEIPAATQLFTPDWIVRYMVENSLGRLWVEGHPNEELKAGWKYYLEEAEQEPEVVAELEKLRAEYRTIEPEAIKVIDPCMGSGHILVYCFDVLMQIYEAQGYSKREAAQSILANNLYGLDIDGRAAQLSYFAVMMKARQYDRRIFSRGVQPHIHGIVESNFLNQSQLECLGAGLSENDRDEAMKQIETLIEILRDAKEYGSILSVEQMDWELLFRFADSLSDADQISLDTVGAEQTQELLLKLIEVGKTLAQSYDVVVTNPPYMGSSGMGKRLSDFVKKYYRDTKSDLSTVCMEKTLELCKTSGYMAMINIPVWMFLSSYEKLRNKLLIHNTIISMVHPGRGIFGSDFGTTTFVVAKWYISNYKGIYRRLFNRQGDVESVENREKGFLSGIGCHVAKQLNFSKIPGSPIAYWVNEAVLDKFKRFPLLGDKYKLLAGTSTGDNTQYLRFWAEVEYTNISRNAPKCTSKRWYPCNTGGDFRKYTVKVDYIIDWEKDGMRIRNHINSKGKIGSAVRNRDYFFQSGLTWNKLSSSNFGVRRIPNGYISDDTARMIACNGEDLLLLLGFLCSTVCSYYLRILSPTLSFTNSELQRLPICFGNRALDIEDHVTHNLRYSEDDRNSFETSWDFQRHPLFRKVPTIAEAFEQWQNECDIRFTQLKANEEEMNRIFIDIYGLQDELTPEVEDKDVTVRKADLRRDVKSLLSYAVGCMFGRYSLDMDGLAYAGGEWDDGKYSTFVPDEDNCIPITDEEYLEDDIVGLLCAWLKKVYGAETLEENLDFIAKALGNKGSTSREMIRNYFLKDFMKDHIKIYQKRPIYWLFDSGKQNGFKALVYLHRYTPDTIGDLRIDYLHRMQRIYESEMSRMQDMMDHSTNSREVAAAVKRREKLQKQLKECKEYDEKISHLALSRIELDLDDGVKVNYRKAQTASDGKLYEVLADSKAIMVKPK